MRGLTATRLFVFRYVDDFLVRLKKRPTNTYEDAIAEVLSVFRCHGKGLTITHELTKDNRIQFLDIAITFCDNHVCWKYKPRSQKDLLPYDSAHSKTIKRAIASQCIMSALKNSCPHKAQESFEAQITRLNQAGFPQSVVPSAAQALLNKLRTENASIENGSERNKKRGVVPYVHKTSHNLKKVMKRYGVKWRFGNSKACQDVFAH